MRRTAKRGRVLFYFLFCPLPGMGALPYTLSHHIVPRGRTGRWAGLVVVCCRAEAGASRPRVGTTLQFTRTIPVARRGAPVSWKHRARHPRVEVEDARIARLHPCIQTRLMNGVSGGYDRMENVQYRHRPVGNAFRPPSRGHHCGAPHWCEAGCCMKAPGPMGVAELQRQVGSRCSDDTCI